MKVNALDSLTASIELALLRNVSAQIASSSSLELEGISGVVVCGITQHNANAGSARKSSLTLTSNFILWYVVAVALRRVEVASCPARAVISKVVGSTAGIPGGVYHAGRGHK